jgi:hypothetical protein
MPERDGDPWKTGLRVIGPQSTRKEGGRIITQRLRPTYQNEGDDEGISELLSGVSRYDVQAGGLSRFGQWARTQAPTQHQAADYQATGTSRRELHQSPTEEMPASEREPESSFPQPRPSFESTPRSRAGPSETREQRFQYSEPWLEFPDSPSDFGGRETPESSFDSAWKNEPLPGKEETSRDKFGSIRDEIEHLFEDD